MFCINCGQKIDDDVKVCPHCGFVLEDEQEETPVGETQEEEKPSEEKTVVIGDTDSVDDAKTVIYTGHEENSGHVNNSVPKEEHGKIQDIRPKDDSIPPRVDEKPDFDGTESPADDKKSGKKHGAIIGISALIVVIVVLGFVAFNVFGNGFGSKKDDKTEYPGVYFLKDNELHFSKFNGKSQVKLEDDIYDKWSDSDEYGLYAYYGFKISEDEKKIFFITDMDNDDNSGDLVYMSATGNGEVTRISDNVKEFRLVGNNKVLFTDEDDSLYISDLKDKTRISKNVRYYTVDEDDKYIVWLDENDSLYYQPTNLKQEKEKLDKDVSSIDSISDGLERILYRKIEDGKAEVYLMKNRKDKEKIVSNADYAHCFIKNGKACVYYCKDKGDVPYSYMDIIEDDYPDDANMKEPDIKDYTTYENVDSFWGPTTREKVDDKYYDELDKYKEKVQRDSTREYLKKHSIELNETALYYLEEGSEAAKVASGIMEIDSARKLDDDRVLFYYSIDMANVEKIKLSKVIEGNSTESELEDNITEIMKINIVNGKDTAVIDFGDVDIGDIYIANADDKLYFVLYEKGDTDSDKSGTLYSIGYSGKNLGVANKFASDVNSIVSVKEDKICYSKERDDDGTFDLYCGDKKVDSEVMTRVSITDAGVLYFKDYESNDSEGTLYLYKDGKSVKIGEDVHMFYAYSDKYVAILTDYSKKNHMGDLEIFDGKGKKKIASDVNAIVY